MSPFEYPTWEAFPPDRRAIISKIQLIKKKRFFHLGKRGSEEGKVSPMLSDDSNFGPPPREIGIEKDWILSEDCRFNQNGFVPEIFCHVDYF